MKLVGLPVVLLLWPEPPIYEHLGYTSYPGEPGRPCPSSDPCGGQASTLGMEASSEMERSQHGGDSALNNPFSSSVSSSTLGWTPFLQGQLSATHPPHICFKIMINGEAVGAWERGANPSRAKAVTAYDGHVVEGGFP